jgi:hypothetical protein
MESDEVKRQALVLQDYQSNIVLVMGDFKKCFSFLCKNMNFHNYEFL